MTSPDKDARHKEWSPRFWEGADFFAWLKLLARNRFAVEPPYWYIAAIVSAMSLSNMILRWCQEGQYGRRAHSLKLEHDPIFVLGHWRSGTTLLHELLIQDVRFTAPSTHDCFMPGHFLLSDRFFKDHLQFLMPSRRPMDNMAAGWDRPQEEEFALCLLGAPSSYVDVAFPNRPFNSSGSLDFSSVNRRELEFWMRELDRFVRFLTLRDSRRLVLKSPPHTARVPELLKLFPNAKFIHISRDPFVLFPSTVRLWTSLAKKHGLQTPRNPAAIDEKVFREFRLIYERWFQTKSLIPEGNLVEIRYEELIKDMPGKMCQVYAGLNLDGYGAVLPKLEEYVKNSRNYETNRYEMPESLRAAIAARWGDWIQKLGYA